MICTFCKSKEICTEINQKTYKALKTCIGCKESKEKITSTSIVWKKFRPPNYNFLCQDKKEYKKWLILNKYKWISNHVIYEYRSSEKKQYYNSYECTSHNDCSHMVSFIYIIFNSKSLTYYSFINILLYLL